MKKIKFAFKVIVYLLQNSVDNIQNIKLTKRVILIIEWLLIHLSSRRKKYGANLKIVMTFSLTLLSCVFLDLVAIIFAIC